MAKKTAAKKASGKAPAPKTEKKAMPKWEKPSEETIKKFYAALPDDKRMERRKMFGLPCTFVNNNMAVGIHKQNIIARLNEADRNDWIKNKKAKIFEPMPGRPMKEYIVIPENIANNEDALKQVVKQSIDYVLTLKPKEKKK